MLFSTVVAPVSISTNSAQGLPFLRILTSTVIACLLIAAILADVKGHLTVVVTWLTFETSAPHSLDNDSSQVSSVSSLAYLHTLLT